MTTWFFACKSRNINAYKTSGSEGGMWGNLIVAQLTRSAPNIKLEAHYVFQSGDHMGGPIHMNCMEMLTMRR